jgi:hypothetical protein
MVRWILTAIAFLLLLRRVLRFVMGLLQGLAAPAPGPRAGGRSGSTRIAGELVRDPVCSTYVPRDSAIAMRVGGELRYYCSASCRDKDLAAGGAQPRARGAGR